MRRPRTSNRLCVCVSLSTKPISDSAQEWVRSQGGDVTIVPSGSGNDAWLAYSESKSTTTPSRTEPFVVLSDPAFRITESEKKCSSVSADEIRLPSNGKVDELTKGGTSAGSETVDGKDEFFKEP